MTKYILALLATIFVFAAGVFAGRYLSDMDRPISLLNPLAEQFEKEKELPLLDYTIRNLRNYNFEPRDIAITGVIQEYPDYTAYEFTYSPLGMKMTGQLNVPSELPEDTKAIVMVRGWAPLSTYYTGMGSKNAAAVFAQNGYITLAPDFFGYGGSDPEPDDTWLARFQKPMAVIELIKSVEQNGVPTNPTAADKTTMNDIGIWAHSNGGQITLTALEIMSQPYPATLWAPVVAPFPYSVLFFSDEDLDEGKEFRKYVALFEEDYDVFEFSITKQLDLLTGPFQLHHGTGDTAAPSVWSDEFFEKVEAENDRRENLRDELAQIEDQLATTSAATASALNSREEQIESNNILEPIEYEYFKYPGADHNLSPNWNTAVERDLAFFSEYL